MQQRILLVQQGDNKESGQQQPGHLSQLHGYEREEKVNRSQEWVEGDAMLAMLNAPKKASRKRG